MSVQDIQAAITELPEGELESLMAWIEEYRAEAWDRQIAQDVEAGRFDALREQVRRQRQVVPAVQGGTGRAVFCEG